MPNITQKLTERIDDLKQKIAAWGKRIRRFTEWSMRFNQNRLFQSDKKRLYKSLERPEVCGAGPGPDHANTVAFWRGLWSEPVNHSEGPWTEVVARLSALRSLAGGAAGIAKAVNDSKAAQKSLQESERHNRMMEAVALGKGLYTKSHEQGAGLYLNPSKD
ncbi:unnamed protein product [Parnassius apollo]|uniref:(apollo) hypothetical protein n=1 Tax=Parnassius apollo TaxID=110799 RepID=A0A8S3WC46_PARAO|nr:unnamed protein product [Parnassius apollo]